MDTIFLPQPQLDLDYLLMRSIKNRRTTRKFVHNELSLQEISNILWVACGETKKAIPTSKNKRTIPSACNSQKVSIYITLKSGVYRYIESDHILEFISVFDIRDDIVKQKMLKHAPLGLVYVARRELTSGIIKHDDVTQAMLVGTEVGAMSQNVYLYCASAHLNTVLVGLIDKIKLGSLLDLSDNIEVVFTQVIG